MRQLVTTSGSILDQLAYDSYGNIVSETNSANGDRFKYTGREFDSEVNLYFDRERYSSPADGRFLNEDPSGFGAGDFNLDRYVGNSPTNFSDPTGQDEESTRDQYIESFRKRGKPGEVTLTPAEEQWARGAIVELKKAIDNNTQALKKLQDHQAAILSKLADDTALTRASGFGNELTGFFSARLYIKMKIGQDLLQKDQFLIDLWQAGKEKFEGQLKDLEGYLKK